MKKIILPLATNATTWKNYSQYLNWIDMDISSLEDYLLYFNPGFEIQNTTIYAVKSNTTDEIKIAPKTNVIIKSVVEDDTKTIIFPHNLSFRGGYFNGRTDVKICFDENLIPPSDDDNVSLSLWDSSKDFPANFSVIRIKRQSEDKDGEENFQIIANPTAGLFIPQMSSNKFIMKYVDDGQRTLGSSLFFALEVGPSRYYIKEQYWRADTTIFSIANARKNETTTTINIQNKEGVVWSNSYPLMSECYIETINTDNTMIVEEFVFDKNITITQTNFENQSAFVYNINATNVDAIETAKWSQFVKVIII